MKALKLNKPHVLILAGVPGSGRTAFGEQFAELYKWPEGISYSMGGENAENAADDVSAKDTKEKEISEEKKDSVEESNSTSKSNTEKGE